MNKNNQINTIEKFLTNSDRGEGDNDTWRVYDYICRHFLATVSHDLRYKQTTSKLTVGSEKFSCTTNKLVDPGYTKIMTWQAFGKDDLAQTFKQGDSVKINEFKLVESQTGPPDYLTESELITLMEKHGIGTGKTQKHYWNSEKIWPMIFIY